jgi:hypothetical protein
VTDEELRECEEALLLKTAELFSLWLELPSVHPMGPTEMLFHIHAIQNMVLAGQAARQRSEKGQQDPRRKWKR